MRAQARDGPRGERREGAAPSPAAPRAHEKQRRDVHDRNQHDHVPTPPRQDEVPSQSGQRQHGQGAAAARQESPAEQTAGQKRDAPGQGRGKPHAEDGRAPEQERQPVPFEVEHADGAVELRHAERNGPNRIGEVREAALEGERRLDQ